MVAGDSPDDGAYDFAAMGERVPFTRSMRPPIDAEVRRHITDNHRFGAGIVGKSEFPQSWDDNRIIAAVDEVMRSPKGIIRFGDKFVFRKRIDGIEVKVNVRVDLNPPQIWTAYPDYRTGVR